MVSATSSSRSKSAASRNISGRLVPRPGRGPARFGGHDGVVADFSADAIVPGGAALRLVGRTAFHVAGHQGHRSLFQRTAAQALASGLPALDARRRPCGRRRHAAALSDQSAMEAHSFVEYDRLLGDAAASPLVTTARLTQPGVGRSRRILFVRRSRSVAAASPRRCGKTIPSIGAAPLALLVPRKGAAWAGPHTASDRRRCSDVVPANAATHTPGLLDVAAE